MGRPIFRNRWFATLILVCAGACSSVGNENTGTTSNQSTETLSCVDSTGDGVIVGCTEYATPAPARDDAVLATAVEVDDTVVLELAWYKESGCCFTDIKLTGLLPKASLVPGVHMVDAVATDWSGCNPSGSGPMEETPLFAIEIVEVTDVCVSGRFFEDADGSGEPGYGFVAAR